MKKLSNKRLFSQAKTAKTASKQETREILKRLTNPKKILQQELQQSREDATGLMQDTSQIRSNASSGSANIQEKVDLEIELIPKPVEVDSPAVITTMETTDTIGAVTEQKEATKNTMINLADSGFLEPVIEREYAEKPQNQSPRKEETPQADHAMLGKEQKDISSTLSADPAAQKPKIIFAPKITLQTDDTYKKVVGEETVIENNSNSQQASEARIPLMQYQEASFDTGDEAQPLGRQMGEAAGHTTSEWAFGMLENFYPEVVAFFTNIPTAWIEKAKLPNELEVELVSKVLAANSKNKNRVKISDFHKKNILPPLQRILSKKGWENVMPDELQLVIGLVVLAADSFFKIQEIRKENRLLEKQLKQKVQQYIDVRTEERKEIDSLKGEISTMRELMAQFVKAQPAAA